MILEKSSRVPRSQGAWTLAQQFLDKVFASDMAEASPYTVTQKYTEDELKIITDTSKIPVTIPPPPTHEGAYVTPTPKAISLSSSATATIGTSPDFARDALMQSIQTAKASLELMIYQVTDMGLCEELISMHKAGLNVTIVVSPRIYGPEDCEDANKCYAQLNTAGLTIHKSPSYYTFSHQKFWIMDGSVVSWGAGRAAPRGMLDWRAHTGVAGTGNWSPSDYPTGSTFPPYGNADWQKTNRDFTTTVSDAAVVDVFRNVLAQDKDRGYPWTPEYMVYCGF